MRENKNLGKEQKLQVLTYKRVLSLKICEYMHLLVHKHFNRLHSGASVKKTNDIL